MSGHELPDHVATDLRNVLLGEADANPLCNMFSVLAGEDPAVDTAYLLGDGSDDLRGEDPGIIHTVEPNGCVVHVCLDVARTSLALDSERRLSM